MRLLNSTVVTLPLRSDQLHHWIDPQHHWTGEDSARILNRALEVSLVHWNVFEIFTYHHYAVFSFQVDVVAGEAKHEFTAETDITWDDFRSRVLVHLDNAMHAVQLACKVSGDTGKLSHLNNVDDFNATIERLRQRAYNARTRAVCLEVKNIVSASASNNRPGFKYNVFFSGQT